MSESKNFDDIPQLQKGKYISLKTYRKNGDGVSSPVWFVAGSHKIYVCTGGSAFKAKRIRNNPQVQIASSSGRKENSKYFNANAQILASDKTKPVYNLFRKKYRMFRVWSYFKNRGKPEDEKQIYLEITLT